MAKIGSRKRKIEKTRKNDIFFSILKGLKLLLNFMLKNIDFNRNSFKMAKIGSRPWPWPWPWPWPRDFRRSKKTKKTLAPAARILKDFGFADFPQWEALTPQAPISLVFFHLLLRRSRRRDVRRHFKTNFSALRRPRGAFDLLQHVNIPPSIL